MEQSFSNARIVLADGMIDGSVLIRDGKIIAIDEGPSAVGEDLEGDYLIAGLIELHTDHLEAHYKPRPGVRWDAVSALQAHDAQIAGSGITTVFDCLRVGSDYDLHAEPGEMRALADTISVSQAEGRLRAEHFIHLRCEVSSPNALEEFATFHDHDDLRMVSLMDHAPGQRQFQTMDQYELYYRKQRGLTDGEFAEFVKLRKAQSEEYSQPYRQNISAYCRERRITLASHDDATIEHVDESLELGVRIAEFPTSLEAAHASSENGLSVLMGAPNVVRGKSHSGNVSARELASDGLLHLLSSDYVPISLMHAPFILADEHEEISLPQALAMVSDSSAMAVGLEDRGRIEIGRRADMVRVHRSQGAPVVRAVWSEGRRVS